MSALTRTAWQVLVAAVAGLWLSGCAAQTNTNDGTENFQPQRLLDPFEPITEFDVRTAAEVGDALAAEELVLGVVVGQQARAYPINMLTGPQREIINDRLGGQAIAATW